MLPQADESLPLHRICLIVDEVARVHPRGYELTKELIELAAELVREEYRPLPIETAPKDAGRKLLLYCPGQGWVVGEWLISRWTAVWTWDLLHPTYWIDWRAAPIDRQRSNDDNIA